VAEPIFGVIDIGSNTVHLLVARVEGSRVVPLVDAAAELYLGRDVADGGSISRARLHATLLKLQEYQATATEAGVTRLHLIATQAIRAARNRDAVCTAIGQATGVPVQVLSPEHEAALAFVGAEAVAPTPGEHVVIDIGGGSVQVGIGAGERLEQSVSLPLGATRLSAEFLPGDPPAGVEEAMLTAYLRREVPQAMARPAGAVTTAIAVGGMARRVPQLLGEPLGVPFPPARLDEALAAVRGQPMAVLAAAGILEQYRARCVLHGKLFLRVLVQVCQVR
jgi:exopolyphosphatase/guanosine-5'-triphosphate,3'-diphosphate pyrophosphatase